MGEGRALLTDNIGEVNCDLVIHFGNHRLALYELVRDRHGQELVEECLTFLLLLQVVARPLIDECLEVLCIVLHALQQII
jgi:hypothetical protein